MKPPILSLDEIKTDKQFEELVAAYFRSRRSKKSSNIDRVDVNHSGVGPDGGKDILVDLQFSDGIGGFNRRWVVQCKYHNRNISPSTLNDNNIPTLIHSYNADGYLLICRKNPTSKLTALFDRLNQNCNFKYRYEVWSGPMFLSQLLIADEKIKKQFFPIYYSNEKMLEKKKTTNKKTR